MARSQSRRRSIAIVATVGAALCLLTACGGQWLSEIEKAENGGSVAEPMPVPEDERAKDVLESIEVNKALAEDVPPEYRSEGLKVVSSVGYPPMELWAPNGDDAIGVDPAIAQGIARTLGLRMTLEDQEFNSMIPGLMSDRYDMLLSSMTDNAERRQTTSFVDYVSAGNAFLVEAGNPEGIEEPSDLCGEIIAVVEGGSSALVAEELSKKCEDAGEEPYEILTFQGDGEANLTVQSGRAVATITDYPVAAARAANPESKVTAVRIDGGESAWGIGIDKRDTALVEVVRDALQDMIDNGSYQKILDAWDVGEMAVDSAVINGGE